MKKYFKFFFIFFVFSCWIPHIASAQVINIPDANLAAAVRETLRLAPNVPITRLDMQRLRVLDERELQTRQIANLTGLEHATQLEILILINDQLRDLNPLVRLTQLELLALVDSQISNLSPLVGLTRLTELWLADNQIRDVRPLAGLTQLKKLILRSNQIVNVNPLTGLTQLETLELWGNQISDVRPLSGLTQLIALTVGSNQISDINPLAGLTQLELLALNQNQISDIQPLEGLKQLERLFLEVNQISDVRPLSGLTRLKELWLQQNNIRDVSPLAKLVNLEKLLLAGNLIRDTSSLASLKKLVEVDFRITTPPPPRDSKDLIPDPNLAAAVREALGLAPNAVITKQGMQGLTRLIARNHQITNLTGLEHATRLVGLSVGFNQIQDISPLSGLTQLVELDLAGNQIRDISPLAGLTQLEGLGLSHNQITDASPLAGLVQLKILWLWNNRISDVRPLAGLVNLEKLYLVGNPVEDTSPLASLIRLVEMDIEITIPVSDPDSKVVIPDPNLAVAVREALGLAPNVPITRQEMLRLTTLDAARDEVDELDFPISDLTGLEHATQLEELNLWQHRRINDISPLAGLVQLRKLYLGDNIISDISPLAGLTQLRELHLGSNQISDISPLAGLTQLRDLALYRNQIRDISALAGLTQLKWLYLAENQIRDISALAGLTQLKWLGFLGLGDNQISDISPLANLTQLETLDLQNNRIHDVNPLARLVNLEKLVLAGNPITDTSPLASLTKLVEVDVEITAPVATVNISPSQVPSPAVGEQLTFSLNIANAENVAGYQATLSYDTSALRYVSSAYGDYLPSGAFSVPPVAIGNTVTLASTSQSGEKSGDGTLATVTFEVVAVKASALTLSDVLLSDSKSIGSRPRVESTQITVPPRPAADINADGIVNIQDMVLVATNFGQIGENAADVNGDKVIDIRDLVMVAGAFGDAAGAPSLNPQALEMFTAIDVQRWLSQAQFLNLTDVTSQRGIRYLEQLLTVLIPKEMALLPNYPNPFNPETWIPYQLVEPADVTLTIYGVNGKIVRRLALGHQAAGVYHSRSRAAYWDGRNQSGESVASGVYFYTLTAGDFTATRKMLIRK